MTKIKFLMLILVFLSLNTGIINSQNIVGKSRFNKARISVSDCWAIEDTVYIQSWLWKQYKSDKLSFDGKMAIAYDERGNKHTGFEYKINAKDNFSNKITMSPDIALTSPLTIKIIGVPDSVAMFKSLIIPFHIDEEHIGDIRKYYRTLPDEIQVVDVPIK